ncbi:MAG: hypothetical protein QMC95_08345 [Desulfitobacteriaceae bacterium]|nr:hypothetical protein [Desulfitobacteriaceae bacterium]
MNWTIILIAVIYMVAVLLIGVWATKRTKSSSDFFVAGRSVGMFVMAIAAFSSIQSGFGMVGGTGLTFLNGLGFVTGVMVAASLGFTLTWFLVGKRMWKIGDLGEIYTLGDVVERRYSSKTVRGLMGFAIALGVIGYLGTQVQAMGVIMSTVFPITPTVGALIGLALIGFYSVGGGMLAGVYTDLLQGVIMAVVSVLAFFVAIDKGGGIMNMTVTLQHSKPLMATPYGTYSMITIASWFFLFSLGAAGQPHFITKFLMIKEAKQLKWGALTSSIAYMMTTLLVIGIGLAAVVLNIQGSFPKLGSSDQALVTFLLNFTSPVVAGLIIAGLMAAIMSTGNSFLNLGAASIVRDIPKAFNIKLNNELLWSRIAVVILLVISTLFSFYLNTLVALLGVFGWGTFASAIFPSVVLGIVWANATKQGAIGSIVISLAMNFILEIGGKYGLHVLPKGVVNGAFALAVSIAAFIIISLLTQKNATKLDRSLQEIIEG